MSEAADEERRRDALYRSILNAVTYTAMEWHVTQRDILFALDDVKRKIPEIFLKGINRPRNKDNEKKDE